MIDEMDRAQESEQRDRDLALQAMAYRVSASHEPRDAGVDLDCIDCGEAIEPARLAALGHKTSRCADCARLFEQRHRGYRS